MYKYKTWSSRVYGMFTSVGGYDMIFDRRITPATSSVRAPELGAGSGDAEGGRNHGYAAWIILDNLGSSWILLDPLQLISTKINLGSAWIRAGGCHWKHLIGQEHQMFHSNKSAPHL